MESICESLVRAVRNSSVFNKEVQVAPACILWPDRERQWEAVIPRLQELLPELCVLGSYEPEKRKGPGIWLRCVLAGKGLEEVTPEFKSMVEEVQKAYKSGSAVPHPTVPIFYLPGVGRQDLRAIEDCPDHLKALAELQYRGVIWSQINAKDWTILAFLKSDQGGLALDVSQDNEAKHAMQLSLYRLLDEDISLLKGKRLDKDYFNSLLTSGDPTREILQWIDQGDAFKASREEHVWEAFVEVTRSQLGFDPVGDGQLFAAEKLAIHEGPWLPVWERYCEAPKRYPHIPEMIRRCGQPTDLFADRRGWPQLNESDEKDLKNSLISVEKMTAHDARARILELEKQHGERRAWVWADLGEAPLANALTYLSELARICEQSIAVGSVEDLVAIYTTSGWEADQAVLNALSQVEKLPNVEAVTSAIQAIYKPWLEDGARHFQELVRKQGYPGKTHNDLKAVEAVTSEVYLFVDGLRFDIAQRLLAQLSQEPSCEATMRHAWSALPSVTATAKPAVSPVADKITGSDISSDFEPSVSETGQSLKGGNPLKKLLKENGWELLTKAEGGDPNGSAWTELGDIDKEGHDRGWKISKEIDRLVNEVRGRVLSLMMEGWTRIRIVTDHGFLLMPGGLPKSNLPTSLTENRWGRCAALKAGSKSEEAHYSWFWNPSHCFALAEGISCYGKKREYTHGGISLQECLTAEILVEAKDSPLQLSSIEITDHVWRGMRFTLAVEGEVKGLSLDIRKRPGDPTTSLVLSVKEFQTSGKASVIVENDQHESKQAFAVILDESGRLLAQMETTIGG